MNNIENLASCCNMLLSLLLKLYHDNKIDTATLEVNAEKKINFLKDNLETLNGKEKEKAIAMLKEFEIIFDPLTR